MTAIRTIVVIAIAGTVSLLAAVPAVQAQQDSSRYGSWQSGAATQDSGIQSLVDELRKLVDEAERARAADPRLLRDLRSLAGRYDRPWRVSILHDDFPDGDFTRSPAWTVTAGEFRAERGWGLVSDVQAVQAATGAEQGGSKSSSKDLAAALITGLLSQYSQPQQQNQPATATPGTPARIDTRAPITNSFSLDTTVGTETGSQRIELAVFQRAPDGDSYILAFSPSAAVPLELLRGGSRGTSVIDSYRQPLAGGAQATYQIAWTRDANGEMVVSIDGAEAIRTVDRALRDPFDGIAITNRGGRFLVREIGIAGVR